MCKIQAVVKHSSSSSSSRRSRSQLTYSISLQFRRGRSGKFNLQVKNPNKVSRAYLLDFSNYNYYRLIVRGVSKRHECGSRETSPKCDAPLTAITFQTTPIWLYTVSFAPLLLLPMPTMVGPHCFDSPFT